MLVVKIKIVQGIGRFKLTRRWKNLYTMLIIMLSAHARGGSEDAVLLNHFLNGGTSYQSQFGMPYANEDAVLLDYFLNDRGASKNQYQNAPQLESNKDWPIRAKFVGMSGVTPIYISTEGLSRQKNGDVLFWMLRSWDEIKKIGDVPFLSNSTMIQLDCQSQTAKTVANMYWSGSYLRGKLVKEDMTEGKKFNIASSGQLGGTIIRSLCPQEDFGFLPLERR